jgi:hypothetical protein
MRRDGCVWLMALACWLPGCTKTPDLHVVRPAMAHLQYPNRVALEPNWPGDEQQDFRRQLQERLKNVPGKLLTVDAGSGLKLSARVAKEAPVASPLAVRETTCWDHSKEPTTSHACVFSRRTLQVKVVVSVALRDAAGRSLLDLTLPFSAKGVSSRSVDKAVYGPGQEAPEVDPNQLYRQVFAEAAGRFAQALAPYVETFTRTRLDCGDHSKYCVLGWNALSACKYEQATQNFIRASEALEGKQKAAALWGLALTQELTADFAAARQTLRQAQALDSEEKAFGVELSRLGNEQLLRTRLEAQRAGALTACELPSAPARPSR